tara:strand:- start:106 stop:993 length:888 start_codon:yes stop_codon:yes gene_type:complete
MENNNLANKNLLNKNLLNKNLKICSNNPLTGYTRNGKCEKHMLDFGTHTVCAIIDKKFLDYSKSKGNDLTSVVKPGQKWCLCEKRWEEAYDAGCGPKVVLSSTNNNINPRIKKKIFQQKNKKIKSIKITKTEKNNKIKSIKKTKTKKNKNKIKTNKLIKNRKSKYDLKTKRKQIPNKRPFLFNPNNPRTSFDVYIDKDPSDTIPIKYTTVKDVEDTINKLERLYKQGKYPHKRIWQVGMILKVRLGAMKKYKKTKYPNAKFVNERYSLAEKYFKFLGQRTKIKGDEARKKFTFNN